nr:nitrogen fixation protein FixH [uncultured Roseateles sp.]
MQQQDSRTAGQPAKLPARQPWWTEPTMWLVVGGPSIVVVASFFTLSLALRFPDAVIEDHGQGADAVQVKDAAEGKAPATALAPAMKARNHAATGGQ